MSESNSRPSLFRRIEAALDSETALRVNTVLSIATVVGLCVYMLAIG